jgi:mannitol/fructose-specific phosphotransferase system IIA component (Ntr-type)
VPQDANELHLQILGELAQLLGDEGTRERLLVAEEAELHKLLTTWTP